MQVQLTDLGQEKAVDVMDIIFKYMAILHSEKGVSEVIFDELKALAEMSFNFQERSAPFSYVQNLASSMQVSELRDWLQHYVPQVGNSLLMHLCCIRQLMAQNQDAQLDTSQPLVMDECN